MAKGYRSLAVTYGEERLEFVVEPSPSRVASIRIDVDPAGGVKVIAPHRASDAEIRAAVRRRAKWIWKHHQPHRGPARQNRAISGEEIIYLGRRYLLKVERGSDESVKLKGGRLVVRLAENEPEAVMSAIDGWYRNRAKEYFARRIAALHSPAFDKIASPPDFALRLMRRQWGSCSPTGRLLLNPLLIRAPRICIDYVIAHELCHLRHHDHGTGFFRLLNTRMPDWNERKSFLEIVAPQILSPLITREN